jgi:hypothetical protein
MKARKQTTRMAVSLWLCLLVATMFVGVVAAGDEMLQVGMLAPEFTATAFDGRTISLADLRAKGPVVLVFLRSCG